MSEAKSITTFLRPGTTYLPVGFSRWALEEFGRGEVAPLLQELRGRENSYERVGVDRVLAIALDLAMLRTPPQARILDVGCSTGTMSLLLSKIGYRVTGIDSDVVARVQGWQDATALTEAREEHSSEHCRLLQVDARQYLEQTNETFDVALLLSVLHHWLPGYGYTGEARFDRSEMRTLLRTLCGRVRSYLYVETPIVDEIQEMPPDPEGEFLFPGWFLACGLATDARYICSTIATNGKPRRLYRLDLA